MEGSERERDWACGAARERRWRLGKDLEYNRASAVGDPGDGRFFWTHLSSLAL